MLKELIVNRYIFCLYLNVRQKNSLFTGFNAPYSLERKERGGDLMLFVRENIPSKLLPNVNPSGNVENILVYINLRLSSI